ncbi:unnamed protein product, partial [Mesorhabditis spiculigera]
METAVNGLPEVALNGGTDSPIPANLFAKSPSECSTKSDFDLAERLVPVRSPFTNPCPSPLMMGLAPTLGAPLDSEGSSRSSVELQQQQPRVLLEANRSFRESRSHDRTSNGSSSSEDESFADAERPSSRRSSQGQHQISHLRIANAARGRLANIRRESSCSVDSEISHERLFKTSQKVSQQWDDFSIEPERPESAGSAHRRNTLSEPISVSIMNAFMPHSCSPSPTRFEGGKQCYSPSTHSFVRSNIPYSPSPSPTRSPTRQRWIQDKLRSASPSPIATPSRAAMKRRANELGNGSDYTEYKKMAYPRGATSPLVVGEKPFPFPVAIDFTQPSTSMLFAHPKRPELHRRISMESPSHRDPETPMDEGLDSSDPFARPLSNESALTDPNPGSMSMASGLDTNPPTPLSSVSGFGEPPSASELDASMNEILETSEANSEVSELLAMPDPDLPEMGSIPEEPLPISDPAIGSSTDGNPTA